ncbi:MAG: alpha/beta fold hydrolase [Streptosporangiaceae bacterium]
MGETGQTRRVRAGQVDLACQVSGDEQAPPMVLLHALGERGADWAAVAGRFARRYRVYAPDLRGHGDSDWPGAYSFALLRDDVCAFLDALGLARVTLVGHSMGGAVAFGVTLERPDLVARLVAEDVVPPYPRDRPPPERPDGPLDFDWAVVPAIVTQVNAGDSAAWTALPGIVAPTLIVGGGEASHIDQARLAQAARLIPRCDLVTIPAGHLVHASEPERFARTVLDWLAKQGPDTPDRPG